MEKAWEVKGKFITKIKQNHKKNISKNKNKPFHAKTRKKFSTSIKIYLILDHLGLILIGVGASLAFKSTSSLKSFSGDSSF